MKWHEELVRQSTSAAAALNTAPPQVNIKVKFVEVSQDDTKALGFDWWYGNVLMNSGADGVPAGPTPLFRAPTSANPLGAFPGDRNAGSANTPSAILTEPQFNAVNKALQQRSGVKLLSEPEITIISGRQGQMKSTTIKNLVTGINERALTSPGMTTTNGDESPLYVTKPMEFGQTLDVVASVLDDGYTIALTMTPTVTDFLGYVENPTNRVALYLNGKKKLVTPLIPCLRKQQAASAVNVPDGQTVMLRAQPSQDGRMVMTQGIVDQVPMLGDLPLLGRFFRSQSEVVMEPTLLIFVTPTIIDPAGNRVHAADETPSLRGGTAPQPAR
jgi:Flp pilus assembly secretin CpaC